MVQSLWRTVWRFLKKLGIKLPYDPTIPVLGIYPERTIIKKDTCTPVFTAALFTIGHGSNLDVTLIFADAEIEAERDSLDPGYKYCF